MTWEETIQFAREKKEFKELIKYCYLTDDLVWNVKEYGISEEYIEILRLIRECAPKAKELLEFGAGNGIASINFAINGYNVLSSEPDKSETVGAGAIKKLATHFNLKNISVIESYAEDVKESANKFDIVFARQCMHHANDLEAFTQNAYRLLKPGGLFFTVRDHVINSENNRQEFLRTHPFHQYYGGENAYTLKEYELALIKAGFKIAKRLGYFDSIINYFPEKDPLNKLTTQRNGQIKSKFPVLSNSTISKGILLRLFDIKHGPVSDDSNIIGRMYSFIATK
ncbi:MAG: class I SAM-dependent methyltransferase [Bacteroidetes bacterium]|nr:class I SAM-dependent methyltransferase [Bacteroidota bacterium]